MLSPYQDREKCPMLIDPPPRPWPFPRPTKRNQTADLLVVRLYQEEVYRLADN